jgi:hypothetical protein
MRPSAVRLVCLMDDVSAVVLFVISYELTRIASKQVVVTVDS